MPDLFDLEAEMNSSSCHGAEWDAKVDRARSRLSKFAALPAAEQTRILNSRTPNGL